MASDLSPLAQNPFSSAVNDFGQLIAQSDRAFLIGAGCSKCAGLPLTSELTESVLTGLCEISKEILKELLQGFQGSTSATIEEYMSELVDEISIASRRSERGASQTEAIIGTKSYAVKNLLQALDDIKGEIARCIATTSSDVSTHWKFVKNIHRVLRAGKRSNPRPTDYFILNYDTLLEDALALECLPFCDGFRGGPTGWWDASTFSTKGLDARVMKLNGSIDWSLLRGEVLPRRFRTAIRNSSSVQFERLLIWPAATKYRETERDPFAQIAQLMRQALRPQPNSDVVLTISGYRFADSHINTELDRALRESERRLTLLVFTASDEPEGILKKWHDDHDVRDQVRIHARKGFFHSNDYPSSAELPWWRFEVLTRLLGGER